MRQAACPSMDPLLQYLYVDLLGISQVLVFHVADPSSISVLQEEDTKLWGYLVLTSWGVLILLSLPRNLTSSIRVGCPPVNNTTM